MDERGVILVVEDDWLLRGALIAELKAVGWTVLAAKSGEEAARISATTQADVLLTDIELAGNMTGWDLAEAFRRDSPDLPIIYASGNASDRSRQVDGSLFFAKPYWMPDVLKACEACSTRGSAQERQHLREANRHISEAERRIARQKARIQKFSSAARELALSRDVLTTFEVALRQMVGHREMIRKELANPMRRGPCA